MAWVMALSLEDTLSAYNNLHCKSIAIQLCDSQSSYHRGPPSESLVETGQLHVRSLYSKL